jgi:hypothetical protein
MSFFNLRIRGRLYSGFGALLLFCVALAGFAVWQLGEIRTQVAALTLPSSNTTSVGEAIAKLDFARDSAKEEIEKILQKTVAETDERIGKTITMLEMVASSAVDRARDRARRHRPAVRPDLGHGGARRRQFQRDSSRA